MNINEAAIYVGTYAKYNNGSIAGKWLKLEDYSSIEEFYTACRELHKNESDPEFMFQDHENIPKSLVWEGGLNENIFEIIQAVSDLDQERQEAFWIYADIYHVDFSKADIADEIQSFNDRYQGHFPGNTEKDFAEHYAEQHMILEQVPQHLHFYFDMELYGRDLFLGDFTETDGHVFYNS